MQAALSRGPVEVKLAPGTYDVTASGPGLPSPVVSNGVVIGNYLADHWPENKIAMTGMPSACARAVTASARACCRPGSAGVARRYRTDELNPARDAARHPIETLTFFGLASGAKGTVWGATNVVPELSMRLWDAVAVRGDLAEGRRLSAADVTDLMDQARGGLATQLESFTHNTTEFLRREQDLLLHGQGVPELRTRIQGRPVVIVVRGYDYREDLRRLRRYIREQRPVLIGVDGGADALLEAHGADVATAAAEPNTQVCPACLGLPGALPVLMAASMFWQQKMMPTTMDPAQAKIMMFMPVMFTFMSLSFPSDLVPSGLLLPCAMAAGAPRPAVTSSTSRLPCRSALSMRLPRSSPSMRLLPDTGMGVDARSKPRSMCFARAVSTHVIVAFSATSLSSTTSESGRVASSALSILIVPR